MKYISISILILVIHISSLKAQVLPENVNFVSPLDIPLFLTGNFAELRSNHFHSGLDFRTQGVEGKRLYAVDSGYVSRISVSPYGYGRAIYVTHYNGYKTVYGHCIKFNTVLEEFVNSVQYEKKSFSVDLTFNENQFPVKRGELIAYSGNTGSSGGPHLHFEVRYAENDLVLNPLLFNFKEKIADSRKPVIKRIAIYPANNQSYVNGKNEKIILKTSPSGGNYNVTSNSVVEVYGSVFFGIDANDFKDGNEFENGIYKTELYVDNSLIYSDIRDYFSFNDTRNINTYTDFEERTAEKKWLHRSLIQPNNHLSFYTYNSNNGCFSFFDDKYHQIKYVVTDEYGNSSKCIFQLKSTTVKPEFEAEEINSARTVYYQNSCYFVQENMMLVIPANTLYDSLLFNYKVSDGNSYLFSKIHNFRQNYVPINKFLTISIKAENLPDSLKEKALICSVDWQGKPYGAIDSEMVGEFVVGKTRYFSAWAICVDTIAPIIEPQNISEGKNMTSQSEILVEISDEFSGIASYNGYIDNQWVMFEYDAKDNELFYVYDNNCLKNRNHNLKIEVIDNKGNIAIYECKFFK